MMAERENAPGDNGGRAIDLTVRHSAADTPIVFLGMQRLDRLLATDGLDIHYEDDGVESVPIVTLKFGPGALNLDLDVALLERLLAEKKVDQ